MIDESIYEVPRENYVYFIKGLKKGCCDIITTETKLYKITEMKSKKTGICYCSRKTYMDEPVEKYYIYDEIVDPDDTQEIEVHPKYVIDNPKDLQKILDYLSKKRKEQDND